MGMGSTAGNHAAANTAGDLQLWETANRAGMLVTINDSPGKLAHVLSLMSKYNIDLTHIQSKPPKVISGVDTMDFHIDFHGSFSDNNVRDCTEEMKSLVLNVTELGTNVVPWFPTKIEDFDFIGKRVLSEGDGI